MKTVTELLKGKSAGVWTVPAQATAYEALQLLAEKDIGAVVVVDKEKPVGIFSERDYARKVILKGRTSKETRVADVMSHPILYVRPEQSVEDCMALITGKRVRHLPVLDSRKRLLGIISIGDVVKAIIDDQNFTINVLENYITGGYG